MPKATLLVALFAAYDTRNLEVVEIRAEENLLLVRGAVPGAKRGIVILRPAVKR